MTKKLKIATIVGTRPELIRLSRVMGALDRHCDHLIVHTGQNYDYELNGIFYEDLGLRQPDVFLEAAGDTAAETIGNIIAKSAKILAEHRPDAVLVLGDTNSCLAVISAKRLKIPTFHMEAGNRCFDMRVPEEINRRIVDHTADINLTYSQIAREYLLREGLDPQRVIVTGSPMREVLSAYGDRIAASNVQEQLGLEKHGYFVVSAHREENIEDPRQFEGLVEILNMLPDRFGLPVILSTHPRTRNKIEATGAKLDPRVQQMKPFGFSDYNALQMNARAVLSDSGTITEESSILNFPALNIRETHERPEGMEEAAVMMVGMNPERVLQGLEILQTQPRGEERALHLVDDYAPDNVSEKIVRIIHSYTDFVNRVVWRKG
ncbi:non-hydrolyzing UDP-N-acetylglucosamine 2-epimerase [Sphingorhabdus sp. 109]|jgi:UDP-N-acetylglucosamine 2-epimerase (non-hydrolysing)|uniref:non-hydrolyzing UDP-N-acetylglucosamine 2-epimerase n=1 Tax=Sphingorhabdus sp. 109 TaxID=2653173 RepID=UPI0012F4352D|nr:UDP-N-acetylglucosamine 2-epimerase (non-hydrolyzing) [Sphingorhabdus sp. 109]VWX60790.1 UDP-2,3-diacetamido-2,3-dideoxy-D-glucuronate 2-epimerase [Sphingorhabdus sp. 109]